MGGRREKNALVRAVERAGWLMYLASVQFLLISGLRVRERVRDG
jgi:hypothetical protein